MKREDKIKSTVNDLDSMGLCDRDEGRVCARQGKVYLLSREEREEVREFVKEQLRKGYI